MGHITTCAAAVPTCCGLRPGNPQLPGATLCAKLPSRRTLLNPHAAAPCRWARCSVPGSAATRPCCWRRAAPRVRWRCGTQRPMRRWPSLRSGSSSRRRASERALGGVMQVPAPTGWLETVCRLALFQTLVLTCSRRLRVQQVEREASQPPACWMHSAAYVSSRKQPTFCVSTLHRCAQAGGALSCWRPAHPFPRTRHPPAVCRAIVRQAAPPAVACVGECIGARVSAATTACTFPSFNAVHNFYREGTRAQSAANRPTCSHLGPLGALARGRLTLDGRDASRPAQACGGAGGGVAICCTVVMACLPAPGHASRVDGYGAGPLAAKGPQAAPRHCEGQGGGRLVSIASPHGPGCWVEGREIGRLQQEATALLLKGREQAKAGRVNASATALDHAGSPRPCMLPKMQAHVRARRQTGWPPAPAGERGEGDEPSSCIQSPKWAESKVRGSGAA